MAVSGARTPLLRFRLKVASLRRQLRSFAFHLLMVVSDARTPLLRFLRPGSTVHPVHKKSPRSGLCIGEPNPALAAQGTNACAAAPGRLS